MKNTNHTIEFRKLNPQTQTSHSLNAVIARQIKRVGSIKNVSRKGGYVAWPEEDENILLPVTRINKNW